MTRPSDAVLCRQLDLVLAGEPVTVDVKSIRDNRPLRQRVGAALAEALASMYDADGKTPDPGAAVARAMPVLLVDGIDLLLELPELYAPELKDKIDAASDEEVMRAGVQVLEVIFPFYSAAVPTLLALVQRSAAGDGAGMTSQR